MFVKIIHSVCLATFSIQRKLNFETEKMAMRGIGNIGLYFLR